MPHAICRLMLMQPLDNIAGVLSPSPTQLPCSPGRACLASHNQPYLICSRCITQSLSLHAYLCVVYTNIEGCTA
jgi:hypothetical protein